MLKTQFENIEILPTWTRFLEIKEASAKVPILAQRKIKNFDPFHLFIALFEEKAGAFLLESGNGPGATARYSFLGESTGRHFELSSDDPDSFHAILEKIQFDSQAEEIPYAPHFWGGWISFFSYESVRHLEPVNFNKQNESGVPDLFLAETGTLLVYDHELQILKAILTLETGSSCFESYKATVDSLNDLWQKIDGLLEDLENRDHSLQEISRLPYHFESGQPQADYCESVTKAKQYIEEGDIYQANLAQRFEVPFHDAPSTLYRNLRAVNPSPFGGLFYLPDGALVSSSPERLVRVDKGWVETRPIAGTRPRGESEKEDSRLSQELLLNEKERAEHLMLVDLERNDLGRVCEYGTVEVDDLMSREQYSHVHHIVSNIRGKLKRHVTLKDILTAVFPGGTITGCPKIRCMEIIEELEPVRRGPYCGSLGYIGYGPYLDLNILIRTFLVKEGRASFHAGAGIVADSVPEEEYRETLSKAAALFQALSLKRP